MNDTSKYSFVQDYFDLYIYIYDINFVCRVFTVDLVVSKVFLKL